MQTAIGYIPQGITLFADDPLGRVIVLRPDVVRKFVNHNIGNRLIIQLQQMRAKNVRSLNPGPIPQNRGLLFQFDFESINRPFNQNQHLRQ